MLNLISPINSSAAAPFLNSPPHRILPNCSFDLFANLKVEKVVYKGRALIYTREFNAVFVTFPKTIMKGSRDEFTVYLLRPSNRSKKRPLGWGHCV